MVGDQGRAQQRSVRRHRRPVQACFSEQNGMPSTYAATPCPSNALRSNARGSFITGYSFNTPRTVLQLPAQIDNFKDATLQGLACAAKLDVDNLLSGRNRLAQRGVGGIAIDGWQSGDSESWPWRLTVRRSLGFGSTAHSPAAGQCQIAHEHQVLALDDAGATICRLQTIMPRRVSSAHRQRQGGMPPAAVNGTSGDWGSLRWLIDRSRSCRPLDARHAAA